MKILNLLVKSIELYISNNRNQTNHYLGSVDFDTVKIDKAHIHPIHVINNTLPAAEKSMNISESYISLIPPPKSKNNT